MIAEDGGLTSQVGESLRERAWRWAVVDGGHHRPGRGAQLFDLAEHVAHCRACQIQSFQRIAIAAKRPLQSVLG